MDAFLKIIGVAVLGAMALVVLSALFALPVYWLWNAVCPVVFKLPVITFTQAWGLNLLCGFLFKSSVYTKKD